MEDDNKKLLPMSEEIAKVGESVTKALRSSKATENTLHTVTGILAQQKLQLLCKNVMIYTSSMNGVSLFNKHGDHECMSP